VPRISARESVALLKDDATGTEDDGGPETADCSGGGGRNNVWSLTSPATGITADRRPGASLLQIDCLVGAVSLR